MAIEKSIQFFHRCPSARFSKKLLNLKDLGEPQATEKHQLSLGCTAFLRKIQN